MEQSPKQPLGKFRDCFLGWRPPVVHYNSLSPSYREHSFTTFPSLPCNETWSCDWILTIEMLEEATYITSRTRTHDSRHVSSMLSFTFPPTGIHCNLASSTQLTITWGMAVPHNERNSSFWLTVDQSCLPIRTMHLWIVTWNTNKLLGSVGYCVVRSLCYSNLALYHN